MLGAFKLARFAYDRLQRQRVPPFWQDQIDLDMLTVQVTTHAFTSKSGLSSTVLYLHGNEGNQPRILSTVTLVMKECKRIFCSAGG